MKIGTKVWVNEKGPPHLWCRSDLVVEDLKDNEVTVKSHRDFGKSVSYAWILELTQVDEQEKPAE